MANPSKPRLTAKHTWQEEFGMKPRFPCNPFKDIRAIIRDTSEPTVFLRPKGSRHTEIVVRLPLPSSVIPSKVRRVYSQHGITLARAFEDILWQKLSGEPDILWTQLTVLVTRAYHEAWVQWFRLQYLGHYHPGTEEWFQRMRKKLLRASRSGNTGRPTSSQTELNSLRRRYETLLPNCKLIHKAAIKSVKECSIENNKELARATIRKSIWEQTASSIHEMPGDGLIFNGLAFREIKRGTRKQSRVELHEPKTWKPEQLAKALLSFERDNAYQTVEKNLRKAILTSRKK